MELRDRQDLRVLKDSLELMGVLDRLGLLDLLVSKVALDLRVSQVFRVFKEEEATQAAVAPKELPAYKDQPD